METSWKALFFGFCITIAAVRCGDDDDDSDDSGLDDASMDAGLDDGAVEDSATDGDAAESLPPILSVHGGNFATCVLTNQHSVKCWGVDGYFVDSLTPVVIPGLETDVVAMDAASLHACAVNAQGGVVCWGYNGDGQLGNGNTTGSLTPVAVSSLSSGVESVGLGSGYSCAVLSSGEIKCWGKNTNGQLGNGNVTSPQLTPVSVTGLNATASKVVGGIFHTCALTTLGAVKCWGRNNAGQMGKGTAAEENFTTPQDVPGLSSGVTDIASGSNTVCALLTDQTVKCWGDNTYGTIGNGTISANIPTPTVATNLSGITQLRTHSHNCALTASHEVKCWGNNSEGQLGRQTTSPAHATADLVQQLETGAIGIGAGVEHSCAVYETGTVKCWGRNDTGQLGNGTTTEDPTFIPVEVLGL